MKNMKTLSLLVITAAVVILQACSSSTGKEETMKAGLEKIPVKVMTVAPMDIASTIQTSGVFTTDDETMLAFKTGGVIEKIYVKEGDAIKKGQLLAKLNLTEIEAQVAQARLGFEKAQRDQQRVKNLYRDSVATLEQYQNVNTALEVANKQYEAARFNLSHSEIRAVNNGFVLRKMASEGQVILPGTPALQTNGASQSNWKLRVGVSDREWAWITIGDKATVTTDALPNQKLEATVTRKSEGSDTMGGAFSVELTVKGNANTLASGLYGKAEIATAKKQRAWSIPYDALLDGNAQSGYVFALADGGRAKKTPITILSIDRDNLLVSSGLENTNQIIISGSAYLKDGSEVAIRK